MIIDLTNVSINYSAPLPEIRLEIPFIELDLTTNTATVRYVHSLPSYMPVEGTLETNTIYNVIDQGSVQMPIPPELLAALTTAYQQYISARYGA